ncbi:MAG: glycosyltransferase family 9 protein, partial [Candidatus Dormibacteraeota bacterium]|nr:glycosyltransferase family 9 protein [Candidatus Dormibacteraeota bacterium]MBO0762828.1 glycosyltransferase family 9 protein [Candidatus Dormibacteraeota bacterium]
TSPAVWGPPPDRTWHRLLWRGRTGDPWGPEPHPGLLDIRPEEVVGAASELLDTSPPPPPIAT